jgi:hypothetical protein
LIRLISYFLIHLLHLELESRFELDNDFSKNSKRKIKGNLIDCSLKDEKAFILFDEKITCLPLNIDTEFELPLTNFSSAPLSCYIEDNYCFIAEGEAGIRILDVSRPAEIVELGVVHIGVAVSSICYDAGTAYCGTNAGIYMVNVPSLDLKNSRPTVRGLFANDKIKYLKKNSQKLVAVSSSQISIYDLQKLQNQDYDPEKIFHVADGNCDLDDINITIQSADTLYLYDSGYGSKRWRRLKSHGTSVVLDNDLVYCTTSSNGGKKDLDVFRVSSRFLKSVSWASNLDVESLELVRASGKYLYGFQNNKSYNYNVLDSLAIGNDSTAILNSIIGFDSPKDAFIWGDNIYVVHSDSVEVFEHKYRSSNELLFTDGKITGPDSLCSQDSCRYTIQKASSRYPCEIDYVLLVNGQEIDSEQNKVGEDSLCFYFNAADYSDSLVLNVLARSNIGESLSPAKTVYIRNECPLISLSICGAVELNKYLIAISEGTTVVIKAEFQIEEHERVDSEFFFLLEGDTLQDWSNNKRLLLKSNSSMNGKKLLIQGRLETESDVVYSAFRKLSVGTVSITMDSLSVNGVRSTTNSFVVRKGSEINIRGALSVESSFPWPVPTVLAYSWTQNDSLLNKVDDGHNLNESLEFAKLLPGIAASGRDKGLLLFASDIRANWRELISCDSPPTIGDTNNLWDLTVQTFNDSVVDDTLRWSFNNCDISMPAVMAWEFDVDYIAPPILTFEDSVVVPKVITKGDSLDLYFASHGDECALAAQLYSEIIVIGPTVKDTIRIDTIEDNCFYKFSESGSYTIYALSHCEHNTYSDKSNELKVDVYGINFKDAHIVAKDSVVKWSEEVSISLSDSATVSPRCQLQYWVAWGDGTVSEPYSNFEEVKTHQYANPSDYAIKAWATGVSCSGITSDTISLVVAVVPQYKLPPDTVSYEALAENVYEFYVEDCDGIEATLNIRKGENENWSNHTIRGSLALPTQYSSLAGTEYYIELKKNSKPYCSLPYKASNSSPAFICIKYLAYEQVVDLKKNKYQMISVPGNLENARVISILNPELGKDKYGEYDWLVYKWDAIRKQNIKLESNSPDRFLPGSAYWLNIMEDKNHISFSNISSINPNVPIRIQFLPGWNQIANPFAACINWGRISERYIEEGLYEWLANYKRTEVTDSTKWKQQKKEVDKFYSSDSIMQPWKGYYAYLDSPIPIHIYLDVNDIERADNGPLPKISTAENSNWSVDFKIQKESGVGQILTAGYSINADVGYDKFDKLLPPPINNPIDAFFPHFDWKKFPSKYSSDIRTNKEGDCWIVSINEVKGQKVELSLLYTFGLGKDKNVVVVDRDNSNATISMLHDKPYQFFTKTTPHTLEFYIGEKSYIETYNFNFTKIPTSNSLEQNYPNPFNPKTTIRYNVKEANYVELGIYNLRGQKIKTLIHEPQMPGEYSIEFSAEEHSSGIYVYQIRIGDFVQNKKMTILK